jgi:riboflavin kinase/FMN adenylyltransferase
MQNSKISFFGPGYDFSLAGVQATDRPSPDFITYVDPSTLTVPQFNARIGFNFKKKWALSFGYDHMKYVMVHGPRYLLSGKIIQGKQLGRTIGFPTANIARDAEGYLPLDGVYAGWLISEGIRYPAAHSVGINETFQAGPRLVESHVLDETELDLYDKVVSLEFVDFVRPAAKFDGVEALVKQINLDLDVVRNQLGL